MSGKCVWRVYVLNEPADLEKFLQEHDKRGWNLYTIFPRRGSELVVIAQVWEEQHESSEH